MLRDQRPWRDGGWRDLLAHPGVALGAIVLVAALLRLPLLGSLPLGFFCDEASAGYDAYAILKTGRDQYGDFLPLYARSFGAYDEFSYRYLIVPFIALFGLSEFTTRLPAALAGIAGVVALYYLGKLWFDRRVALLGALLLAISPWHVQFSRVAFRTILFPLCICLALYWFWRGLERPRLLLLSGLAFALSLHTYSSARTFVPGILLVLGLLYVRELWALRRHVLLSLLLMALVALPAVHFWFTPEGLARAQATIVVDPPKNIAAYLSYFSPDYLFFHGDPELRHHPRIFGQLYPFEIVSVLAGLVAVLRRLTRQHLVALAWLALYPIPAALTEPETAIRSIIGVPLFALLSALGCVQLVQLARGRARPIAAGVAGAAVLVGALLFAHHYYVKYPAYSAGNFQYGFGEAIDYAEQGGYESVLMSDQLFLPHIFVLFYTKYPPEAYQAAPINTLRDWGWFYTGYTFGKYHIASLKDPPALPGRTLIITTGAPGDQPRPGARLVRRIVAPDGLLLMELFEQEAVP